MEFVGFTKEDFEVFDVPGLDARMDALKTHLRPKLEQLGRDMSGVLGDLVGSPMYAHVAKHARRTVNPPNDSWVAFGRDKRGYKKHPHFQIGLWGTHVFALFGMIYESPDRFQYANQIRRHTDEILQLVPSSYVWVPDHMDPHALPAPDVNAATLTDLANRLAAKKQGELLTGLHISRQTALAMSAKVFEETVTDCFTTLLPLYRLATTTEEVLV